MVLKLLALLLLLLLLLLLTAAASGSRQQAASSRQQQAAASDRQPSLPGRSWAAVRAMGRAAERAKAETRRGGEKEREREDWRVGEHASELRACCYLWQKYGASLAHLAANMKNIM